MDIVRVRRSDLNALVDFSIDRDQFKSRAEKEIVVPEPKTAVGHVTAWGRRVGAVLGGVGGAAVLVVGDILAWQNLAWPEAIGATALAVAMAGGSVWYCVDEYSVR